MEYPFSELSGLMRITPPRMLAVLDEPHSWLLLLSVVEYWDPLPLKSLPLLPMVTHRSPWASKRMGPPACHWRVLLSRMSIRFFSVAGCNVSLAPRVKRERRAR